MMNAPYQEQALVFGCEREVLIGVLARPETASRRGVLIIVGGPQYRAGSHRQFTLLARYLAANGIAAMRFDYRGMGDSSGVLHNFEDIDADIRAAIDCFVSSVPELREVILWGLCDAASAAMLYASRDTRVKGLVLLNPWVRTTVGQARSLMRHYYLRQVFDLAFWRRALSGQLAVGRSLHDFVHAAIRSLNLTLRSARASADSGESSLDLPNRMAHALQGFRGPVLLVLSGNDLTAKEFNTTVAASPLWRRLLAQPRVAQRTLVEANHTFSTRIWRDQVARWTLEWVRSW